MDENPPWSGHGSHSSLLLFGQDPDLHGWVRVTQKSPGWNYKLVLQSFQCLPPTEGSRPRVGPRWKIRLCKLASSLRCLTAHDLHGEVTRKACRPSRPSGTILHKSWLEMDKQRLSTLAWSSATYSSPPTKTSCPTVTPHQLVPSTPVSTAVKRALPRVIRALRMAGQLPASLSLSSPSTLDTSFHSQNTDAILSFAGPGTL